MWLTGFVLKGDGARPNERPPLELPPPIKTEPLVMAAEDAGLLQFVICEMPLVMAGDGGTIGEARELEAPGAALPMAAPSFG